MADLLRRLGRLDDAQKAHEHARAVIVRRERRRSAGWWPPDESEPVWWDARIDWGLAVTLKTRGDSAAARELASRAAAGAARAGARVELPAIHALLAGIHRRLGDLDACRAAALEGLHVCRSILVRDARWRATAAELLIALGAVFYSRRHLVRAERCYLQASRIVDEATNPRALSFALNDVAAVRYELGDFAGAHRLFARSLGLKEREGDLHQIAIALGNLAEVELRLGDVSSAIEHARGSVRLAEQATAHADLPDFYRNLAEAQLAAGEDGAAIASAERGFELALLPGGRVYLARNVEALTRIAKAVRGRASTAASGDAARDAIGRALGRLERPAADPGSASGDVSDAAAPKEWLDLLRSALE
jgi:tetratricopeptide (TPR) repeat protein